MTRIRIPVRDLAPGDLVPQTFWTSEEGRRQESGRTVVIGKVISARLKQQGATPVWLLPPPMNFSLAAPVAATNVLKAISMANRGAYVDLKAARSSTLRSPKRF